jgi:prevent-host-death family protein
MKTATVGEIKKNFSRILKEIKAGEEIAVTKRGKPVAKITALGSKNEITWPDFYTEPQLSYRPITQ